MPKSPVRGLFAQNDRTFAVGGDSLYELTRTGGVILRSVTALTTPVTPTITNSPLTAALSAPTMPVVTQGGTLGTTTYGYKVTATNANGETLGSTEGLSTVGNATLNGVNYNVITWTKVTGATGYKVYRTTGPGSGVLVGTVPSATLFLLDTGTVGTTATPLASNTTGGVLGTTTYGYKVVARLGLGVTAASGEGITPTGQATLDVNNYNIITWPAVTYAHRYDVYRTTGGSVTPPILIGSTSAVTFKDTGQSGTSQTPPTADTTSTFTLPNDGTPVQISSSGDAGQQILLVSGGAAFVFDLAANTLGKVVQGATSCGYISGYFLVLDASTSTLKSSQSLDGYAWDPLQIYQRLSAGDRWLSMGVTTNEIWLMGSASSDVWVVTGDPNTRFAPFNNVTIDQGIIAPASLQVNGGVLTWLGQNKNGAGVIWKTRGYDADQISTRGIETETESYSTLADAVAWSYQQKGHTFYVLTFPTDGKTWVYDTLTKEWHRRGYWDPNAMAYASYRPQCHAFAFGGVGFGLHLAGDRLTGTISTMSTSVGTDVDGKVIRRLRQSPHLTDKLELITIYSLILDMQVGQGTATGQGSDPTVMLQISRDGGKTWGPERWRSVGKQGNFRWRVRFGRLGQTRDFVIRIVVTDPIVWQIANCYFEPEEQVTT